MRSYSGACFARGYAVALAVGLAAATLVVGCGGPPFAQAPAKGRISVDGEPLTGGKVMFAPVAAPGEIEAGKPAFGDLDAEGRFVLGTYSTSDGAVVGEHWVTLLGVDDSRRWRFDRLTIPTGRFKVVAGEVNDFDIDLTAELIAKHAKRKR